MTQIFLMYKSGFELNQIDDKAHKVEFAYPKLDYKSMLTLLILQNKTGSKTCFDPVL